MRKENTLPCNDRHHSLAQQIIWSNEGFQLRIRNKNIVIYLSRIRIDEMNLSRQKSG